MDSEQCFQFKSKDNKFTAVIRSLGRLEGRVIPDLFAALMDTIVGQ